MAKSESKSTLKGRSAITDRFKTVEEARRKPNTSVVERVPKSGYGTSK